MLAAFKRLGTNPLAHPPGGARRAFRFAAAYCAVSRHAGLLKGISMKGRGCYRQSILKISMLPAR